MGRVVLTYEGSLPSAAQVRDALLFADQVHQQKSELRLANYTKVTSLQDGSIVYVYDFVDFTRVHVIPVITQEGEPESYEEEIELQVSELMKIISFISGASKTYKSMIDSAGNLRVLNDAVELVVGTGESVKTGNLFSKREASFKIAVEEHSKFARFSFDDVPPLQFRSVTPGLYSGAMSSIVQLLLGVGKLLRDDDYFDRWLRHEKQPIPSFYDLSLVGRQNDASIVHDVSEVETLALFDDSGDDSGDEQFKSMQLAFDYRWHRTHGVVWGNRTVLPELANYPALVSLYADSERIREPFLVEIGNRGVYVTPLFRDNASFYEEIRTIYKRVYPELEQFLPFHGEMLSLFDALGGFPTNECFPESRIELDRMVRSGWVVAADIDLNDFYAGSMVSSGHGWAFSMTSNQATNVTVYDREDGKYAKCYLLTFDIRTKSNISERINPSGLALASVIQFQDFYDSVKALFLPNTIVESITSLALSGRVDDAQQMFDDYTVEPLFDVRVTKSVVAEGFIGFPRIDPQFKVWEPVLNQTISYDFYTPPPVTTKANGPIFSTFVGDNLEILFVCEPEPHVNREEINTRQPCQYTGTYQTGERTSAYTYLGNFYFSSRDLRLLNAAETFNISTVTLTEVGRADHAITEDLFFRQTIWLTRHVFGYEDVINERQDGISYNVRIVQASNNRSVLFIKTTEVKYGYSKTLHLSSLQNWGSTGTSIAGSLYDPIYHSAGGSHTCWNGEYWKECARYTDPENCFGDDPPSEFVYKRSYGIVSSTRQGGIVIVSSTHPGGMIGSAYYTPVPVGRPARSVTLQPRKDLVTERVYGFGVSEIHWKLLKESVDRDVDAPSPFSYLWEMCANGYTCVVDPWYILRNYYGRSFVKTSTDWDRGPIIEIGDLPSMQLPLSAVLFGIVE